MKTQDKNGYELRKIADLTAGEFISLINQIVTDSISQALLKVLPQSDPDEDIYWTTTQAAAYLGLSRQTIQSKKAKGTIKFSKDGRIQRTTKAECKRYLAKYGLYAGSIGKRVENPIRMKRKGKVKK